MVLRITFNFIIDPCNHPNTTANLPARDLSRGHFANSHFSAAMDIRAIVSRRATGRPANH